MSFDQRLQFASIITLVIGIFLVVWEFQQSRAMTAAVLASDGAISRAEIDMQIASVSDVYARACQDTQSLTVEDAIVLTQIYRAFYEAHVNRVMNYQQKLDIGVDWTSNAKAFFYFMFETDFGREHWKRIRGGFGEQFRGIGDDILFEIGPSNCFASQTIERLVR